MRQTNSIIEITWILGYIAIRPKSGAHKSRFRQTLIADVTQNQDRNRHLTQTEMNRKINSKIGNIFNDIMSAIHSLYLPTYSHLQYPISHIKCTCVFLVSMSGIQKMRDTTKQIPKDQIKRKMRKQRTKTSRIDTQTPEQING